METEYNTTFKKKKTGLIIFFAVLLVLLTGLVVFLSTQNDAETVGSMACLAGKRFVIDPGHGGADPGTLGGVTGVSEAHLNLKIAKRLKNALEASGASVVMTRNHDEALAETKAGDMAARRKLIEESGQDITISIHQNHFEDTSVHGPQVFYAPGSIEGAKLAEALQNALNRELEVDKPRTQMEGDYYIVESGTAPAVIIECGFLSNPEEEVLLKKDFYKIKIVRAIMAGLEDYIMSSGASAAVAD